MFFAFELSAPIRHVVKCAYATIIASHSDVQSWVAEGNISKGGIDIPNLECFH